MTAEVLPIFTHDPVLCTKFGPKTTSFEGSSTGQTDGGTGSSKESFFGEGLLKTTDVIDYLGVLESSWVM